MNFEHLLKQISQKCKKTCSTGVFKKKKPVHIFNFEIETFTINNSILYENIKLKKHVLDTDTTIDLLGNSTAPKSKLKIYTILIIAFFIIIFFALLCDVIYLNLNDLSSQSNSFNSIALVKYTFEFCLNSKIESCKNFNFINLWFNDLLIDLLNYYELL